MIGLDISQVDLTRLDPSRRYRVVSFTRHERQHGYEGTHPVRYQSLEVKGWFGWTPVASERVPEWVEAYAAVGGCDWRSGFADFGSWGRDGIVTPHSK